MCHRDLYSITRCTSRPDNLDVYSLRRTPRYTEGLLELVDSKALWINYGIDDDIIVGSLLGLSRTPSCPHKIYSHSHQISHAPTFMR